MDALTIAGGALLAIYSMAALFNFAYSINQVNLALLSRRKAIRTFGKKAPGFTPMVTIQLPVYNERYVVARLIDCVCAMDWPAEKLQIQVLDDSTDDTVTIAAEKIEQWKSRGVNIIHERRRDRTGYKAGALAAATPMASGEFIAIFDADFLPDADFLKQVIPWFNDDDVAVVQARWGHLNADYSILTRLQALGLDTHFFVENQGRAAGGHFLNFNGTAGVWRKCAIEDAGGWNHDTLTEDLDLSYRAQLRGWKLCFLPGVVCMAELPVTMGAVKSQQYRWTKGAAESTRKLLSRVLRSPLPFRTKVHASFHLMNSVVFVCMMLLAVLSIPMLWLKYRFEMFDDWITLNGALFVLTYFNLAFFYYFGYRAANRNTHLLAFVPRYFLLICMALGIAVHNTIAVIEGFAGRKTPFVRTPKFNITQRGEAWKHIRYRAQFMNSVTLLEIAMLCYFLGGAWMSWCYGDITAIPFHLMQVTGFGLVLYLTAKIRG
ncbi:MAG: glycosyltransferase [Flavobacteriales bacterium]|nr:glycosyltransferase [Flavobacteriales bacterium]